jgi:hypothetical protein
LFVDFSWGKEMNPLSETGRLRVDLSLERGGQLLNLGALSPGYPGVY